MKKCFLWFLSIVLTAGVLTSRTKDKFSFTSEGRFSKTMATYSWQKYFHQGFNMQLWIANTMTNGCIAVAGTCGGAGPDGSTVFGLEYPLGSGIEHLYGGGPWIGGLVNGSRHVDEGYNGDDARTEFIPNIQDTVRDRMWTTSVGDSLYDVNRPGYYKRPMNRAHFDDDGDGKIDEDELDGLDNDGDWNPLTDDIGADGVPDSLEVGCKGGYDPVKNPDPAYDNYSTSRTRYDSCHPDIHGSYPRMNDKNKYTERNLLPDHGEPHVDEDFAAISDQDVYCASTDTFRLPVISDHSPMGIKVLMKSYAWAGTFADGILPIEYKFINVGRKVVTNVFVGMFNDFDVGPYTVANYPNHDYAQYFTDLRTGFVNNPVDRGSTPAGVTVLHTPRPLDSLQYVWQWHGFVDPGTLDSTIYGRMAWIGYDTSTRIKPSQSSTNVSDTRFYFSFGPFDTLRPASAHKPGGDTLDIVMCYVGGYSVDKGPHNLHDNAENAIKLYARGWLTPITLPSPCVRIDTGFKKVTVRWGGKVRGADNKECEDPTQKWDDSSKIAQSYSDSSWRRIHPPDSIKHVDPQTGKLMGGRIFEGYRLYRSEDPNGQQSTFTLMGQWDIKDSLGSRYSVPDDYDAGLDPIFDAADSVYYFVDTNLVRGKTYWYAVTAYGVPDRTILQVYDNAGHLRYDTLYAANSESPIIGKSITLPFNPSSKLGDVMVVPNPYRVDNDYTFENGGWEGRAREWNETRRLIKFIHVPLNATIRVFTLAGEQVATLSNAYNQANNLPPGEVTWNLVSQSNRALASGVYVYTVESQYGKQISKFVLIR